MICFIYRGKHNVGGMTMAKQIYDKVTFILYGEDVWRVTVNVDEDGVIVVKVDLV